MLIDVDVYFFDKWLDWSIALALIRKHIISQDSRPTILDENAVIYIHSQWCVPLLVGGLEHFLCSHILGIIIPIDFPIFQRGSNHQPVYLLVHWCCRISRSAYGTWLSFSTSTMTSSPHPKRPLSGCPADPSYLRGPTSTFWWNQTEKFSSSSWQDQWLKWAVFKTLVCWWLVGGLYYPLYIGD